MVVADIAETQIEIDTSAVAHIEAKRMKRRRARKRAYKTRLRDGPASLYTDRSVVRYHYQELRRLILPGLANEEGGRNIIVHGGSGRERVALMEGSVESLHASHDFNEVHIDVSELAVATDLFVRLYEQLTGITLEVKPAFDELKIFFSGYDF